MLFAENCTNKIHRQIQVHLESARWLPVRDRRESAKSRYQLPRQAMGNDVAPTRKSLTPANDHRDREVTVGMMDLQAQGSTYGKG